MILKHFTLAHCYPQWSDLSGVVRNLRSKCLEISPSAKEPKLGDHTTLLPPFRAPIDEMKQFSMGLDIARALYGGKENQSYGETQGINFFRNPGVDAFIVRLGLPAGYHAMIEECRSQLSGFNEWVFPIYGDTYNPHLCILEGPDLYNELSPYLSTLEKLIPTTRFTLPFPQIMVKVKDGEVTRWEEFNPLMGL